VSINRWLSGRFEQGGLMFSKWDVYHGSNQTPVQTAHITPRTIPGISISGIGWSIGSPVFRKKPQSLARYIRRTSTLLKFDAWAPPEQLPIERDYVISSFKGVYIVTDHSCQSQSLLGYQRAHQESTHHSMWRSMILVILSYPILW